MLIATAGHIDHGKTSLIRALTGIETDRLPEEKARGITIDLGFAYWKVDGGATIGFVDVPGHDRFIRNMLAGVGGVDAALIVVAADDGVMPQTIEHVRILDLLGIANGFVAITKCDRATPARIAEVRAAMQALLADTSLAGASLFEVSAATGDGIAALGGALRHAAAAQRARPTNTRTFRLGIDRAFTVTGVGTVVTGTAIDGAVEVGARLLLAPGGAEVRVRGLQSAGERVTRVQAGERCALNLAGVQVGDIHRGDWLLVPDLRETSTRMEVALTLLPDRDAPLKHHTPVHLHLGTADLTARVLIPRQGSIAAGDHAIVQLVLDQPTVAANGDRFVLRDQSGRELLGGGRVVDPFVPGDRRRQAARAPFSAALQAFDAEATLVALLDGGQEVDTVRFQRAFALTPEAAQALYQRHDAILLGRGHGLALPAATVTKVSGEAVACLDRFHADHPDLPGMSVRDLRAALARPISAEAFAALLRDLVEQQLLEFAGALVKRHGHAASFSAAEETLWSRLRDWLDERGALPFTIADVVTELRTSEAAVKALLHRRRANGDLWRMNDKRFLLRDHAATFARLAATLVERSGGEGFTAAQFRDASGLGRNLVIEIVEFLDGIGVTIRQGATRRLGRDHLAVAGAVEPEPAS